LQNNNARTDKNNNTRADENNNARSEDAEEEAPLASWYAEVLELRRRANEYKKRAQVSFLFIFSNGLKLDH
jgi:hypothetical protein